MAGFRKRFNANFKDKPESFEQIELAMKMVDLDIEMKRIPKEGQDEISIDFKSEQDKKKFEMIIVAAGYKGQLID